MRRDPKGRLELTWMGKDSALIPVEEGKYDYAWVDPNDPRALEVKSIETLEQVGDLDGPTGADENLLIVGDSGDALRSLGTIPEYASRYRGQVKLVYIDPPFNTGQTFQHYADQMEHSIWLTMMRDRLRDIKPLLAPGASIWVHLDDAEVHRMRVLLDEEFGAENFLGTVVWQKADGPRNDVPNFSPDQDYILVYGSAPGTRLNRSARSDDLNSIYRSPDGDPQPWYDGDPTAPSAERNQGWVYGIQNPLTGEWMYPANGRCWGARPEAIFASLNEYAPYEMVDLDDAPRRAEICGISESEVRRGVKGMALAVPLDTARISVQRRREEGLLPPFIIRTKGTLGRKRYQPEGGSNIRTLWFNADVGHNRAAKAEIKSLFPGSNPFSTPKPEALLERVIAAATDRGDLVLDCFAGSGTTAAVAHKMGRRWVTIELLEATARTFTIPRMSKVVDGSDRGGVSTIVKRVAADTLPEGMTAAEAQQFNALLSKVVKGMGGVDMDAVKSLRASTKTRDDKSIRWDGGGGFTVAKVGPTMYEVDDEDGEVFLSTAATNGAWSEAVAGQLKFSLTPDHAVFCGVRGRQRLLVVDGVADEAVVRTAVEHLGERERVLVVAKVVLPGVADVLAELSPGSRIKKAPTDIFSKGTVK